MEEFNKCIARAKKRFKNRDKHQVNINRIIKSYEKF